MSKRRRNPGRSYLWLLLGLALVVSGFFLLRRYHLSAQQRPSVPIQKPVPLPEASTGSNPPTPVATTPPPRLVASNPPPTQPVSPVPSNPPPREITRITPPAPRSSETNYFRENPPLGTNATSPTQPVTVLDAQIALLARGISPGSVDGRSGAQTAAAIRAFQEQQGLNPTGWLDRNTMAHLAIEGSPYRFIIITDAEISALRPLPGTWVAKSELDRLGFQNILEYAAEASFSSPTLIKSLNPSTDWEHPFAGMRIQVPNTRFPVAKRASRARINLSARTLEVFDESGSILAHFPCSIARLVDKRPVGELHVTVMIKNPNYTFDPVVFPESEEAREIGHKLIIPPGPNNPVGVVWIGLDRPGYGIHGTPNPEEVGRTESHGCFRLANWNAEYFRQMTWPGMPIDVEP